MLIIRIDNDIYLSRYNNPTSFGCSKDKDQAMKFSWQYPERFYEIVKEMCKNYENVSIELLD